MQFDIYLHSPRVNVVTMHVAKILLREIVTEDLKCCADGNERVYIPTK